jgi:hypothetical protein
MVVWRFSFLTLQFNYSIYLRKNKKIIIIIINNKEIIYSINIDINFIYKTELNMMNESSIVINYMNKKIFKIIMLLISVLLLFLY